MCKPNDMASPKYCIQFKMGQVISGVLDEIQYRTDEEVLVWVRERLSLAHAARRAAERATRLAREEANGRQLQRDRLSEWAGQEYGEDEGRDDPEYASPGDGTTTGGLGVGRTE